ncbi:MULTISPECIES: alpha/beta hydrolase [unclassified Pseudoalteromonas]|uniref:alpha/beta hydrolase n=1 Tax=unclassified Pseudoalteromonas TaxID=194690 RepID=UPI0020972263|nr:alpha/beta hydrolase [Pseudoalteromonas sp. XMcav2-N]MCO7187161.1 alpha/beta hydrolase [Pseudoalteromonas sp. XMcav2-N]
MKNIRYYDFGNSMLRVLLLLTFIMPFGTFSQEQPQSVYENEQAITFKTQDNQQVAAFSGFVTVPENRKLANSRTIRVHYVRFPATTKQPGSPIVYLAGGPGGSGIKTAEYANFRFPLFMALREFGDVIALDQRGTGKSDQLPSCQSGFYTDADTPQTDQEIARLYQDAALKCAASWQAQGIDIKGYTTKQSAADLDDLRRHLKAEKLTLWGISYGTHLALAATKLMPGKLDKLVLASVEGLNQTVKLPAQTDAYFTRVQQAINTQPKAKALYPDIAELIRRVHERLETSPIKIQTIDNNGKKIDFLFQRWHMQRLASSMIADPHRGMKRLLALYRDLDIGITEPLQHIANRGYFSDTQISFRLMPFAMDIASGITQQRLAQVNQQSTTALLGAYLNFPMPQLHGVIAELDLGDAFRKAPVSDVPTLVLSGSLDGRTYPHSQLDAVKNLSDVTQVIIENAGHNLFMRSPQVTEVIKTFLAGKSVQTSNIRVPLVEFY